MSTHAFAAYRGRRVLVIGGLGFLGRWLCRRLAGAGARVTGVTPAIARHDAAARALSARGVVIVEGDLLDSDLLATVVPGQDVVFNLAGRSGAVRSMQEPWADLDVNCRGNLLLLETVRTCNPEAKIVFPGSRLQFGRPSRIPVAEDDAMEPLCVHGVDKLAAERYFVLYHRVYGLRTAVARLTNPYGPGQPGERSAYGVVNWFIHRALEGRTLPIYGDGSQLRDYVFVDDAVAALARVGTADQSDGQVYNVGSGKGVRLADMAQLIVERAGGGRLEPVEWPALAEKIETGDFVADISKIGRELGWRPDVSLEDGVARTIVALRGGAGADAS